MRVIVIGLTLFLSACAVPPEDDLTATMECRVNPLDMVECFERE